LRGGALLPGRAGGSRVLAHCLLENCCTMADFSNLPCRDETSNVHVVVEAPRGSTVKVKFDPEKRAFVYQRALILGLAYPFDWGFVPSTLAEDGDPLDAMVLCETPTWPGIVVPAKPIGVVRMKQKEKGEDGERNDRIIALPAEDERYEDVKELPRRVRQELEHFFIITSEMTNKKVLVQGWEGPEFANKLVDKAAHRYVRGGQE